MLNVVSVAYLLGCDNQYKMKIIVFIALALVSAIVAAPTDSTNYGNNENPMVPPVYTFDYGVKEEKIDLGHSESRDKDDVKGTYYVTLPDGRQQVVKYTVGGGLGYVATIEYIGEAIDTPDYVRDYNKKPENDPQVWPQYQAPKQEPKYQPEPEYNWNPYATTESTTTTTTTTTEKYTVRPEPAYKPEIKIENEPETDDEDENYAAPEDMTSVTIRLFRDDVGPIMARKRNYQPRPVTGW